MLYVTSLCNAWEKVVAALRVEVFQRILAQEVLYSIPYCTELYCTVLYCIVLGWAVLYCTVLYCSVYCTVLYCSVYCTVLTCSVVLAAISILEVSMRWKKTSTVGEVDHAVSPLPAVSCLRRCLGGTCVGLTWPADQLLRQAQGESEG